MYIVIAFISSPKFPKYQMSALCYALDTQRQIRYYALNNFSRKKNGANLVHLYKPTDLFVSYVFFKILHFPNLI